MRKSMNFLTVILEMFPEFWPMANPEGYLKQGKVWMVSSGMHVPDPDANVFSNVSWWYRRGEYERQPYELHLNSGDFKAIGFHVILFVRYMRLYRGAVNQAPPMLRSNNHDPYGNDHTRYAGNSRRREAIAGRINKAIEAGLSVKRQMNRIYIGRLVDSLFGSHILNVPYVAAVAAC